MSRKTLAGWLETLERRAPESNIDLGLERVGRVHRRLGIGQPSCPVITVAGTNGKGSVIAMLESMLVESGRRPFAYTSPHLFEFSERMRIAGEPAPPQAMVEALDAVEQAREQTPLTYFEHITLAALVLAARSRVDALLLETGLGGRLDAVNIIDADVAVITSIGLDHTEWLGRTRAEIAREKAGIARRGRAVIVGERRLPRGMDELLARMGARTLFAGRDFVWRRRGEVFDVRAGKLQVTLPLPGLEGSWQIANAACSVMALIELERRLPVSEGAMRSGLVAARAPGRIQRVGTAPEVIVDVAHNAPAARALASTLGTFRGRSIAVFSVLAGKDIRAMARALDGSFTEWLVAGIAGDRARAGEEIADELENVPVSGRLETVESIPAALRLALDRAGAEDRIVVFGSFRTVAEAWPTLTARL